MAKSLSVFSLKPQPDRLLAVLIIFAWIPVAPKGLRELMPLSELRRARRIKTLLTMHR
jgi:hypothetical protein